MTPPLWLFGSPPLFDWGSLARVDVQGDETFELISLDVPVPAWVMETRIEVLRVR